MRLAYKPAPMFGLETCSECSQHLPLSEEECQARRVGYRAEWLSLSHEQKMGVLHNRIHQDMHQFELTPEEAHRVWSAGCSALLAFRPTALPSDIE